MRVLVVEDEAKLAAFIERGLIEESFAVDVARDGEEAFERMRRTAYDLVILDLMLPRMDASQSATRCEPTASTLLF